MLISWNKIARIFSFESRYTRERWSFDNLNTIGSMFYELFPESKIRSKDFSDGNILWLYDKIIRTEMKTRTLGFQNIHKFQITSHTVSTIGTIAVYGIYIVTSNNFLDNLFRLSDKNREPHSSEF